MKSLKNKNSYKQMSTDYMLGITRQPDNTCPLIDALIYEGNRRSKIYDLSVDYDPTHLRVDVNPLIERIRQLESWSEDVIGLFSEFDELVIDPDDREIFKTFIDEIELKINNNRNSEIRDGEKEINDLVDQWEELFDEYNDTLSILESKQKEISMLESDLDSEDPDDEDNNIKSIENKLEHARDEFSNYEDRLETIKSNFDYDVESRFNGVSESFSELLEEVRKNNDSMRMLTKALKTESFPYLENLYNLEQPIAYLKQIESGHDDEISLGVLDRTADNYFYLSISNYLSKHEVINDIQKKLFQKAQSVNDVVELLKEIGYKKIYYYENKESYISDPKNYIVSYDSPSQKKQNNLKI